MAAGQLSFGENYLQDALPKVAGCPDADWHFIGAIQSRKTSDIAASFDWVHSVASLKVARRLSDAGEINLGRAHIACGRPVVYGPESDVRDVARDIMAELQRGTVTTKS